MIVKCENCQTKFKVADQKISEQGTLVRCSKCEQTFEVMRSAAPSADLAASVAEPPNPASLEDELFGDLPDGDFANEPAYDAYSPPPPPPKAPDHSLFEMPPAPSSPEPAAVAARELLPPEEALLPPSPARSALLGPPGLRPLPPKPSVARTPKLRRIVTGLAVNLAIATGLLLVLGAVGAIYANDGKLDSSAFSIRRIGSSLRATGGAIALESWNGIYDTKSGKPVFYIRGEAQNTSAAAAKLKVRAEILDGAQLVRAAEILAGAAAGPEELYNIASSKDADALATRLEAAATTVASGGRAPFLVTFYDYPPNLSAFRLKVTVRAVAVKETAAR
jgi:predicted Zn finger-like uncharacterized protein